MAQEPRSRSGCCCCSAIIIALLIMIIWNGLVPQVWPGAPHLTFWQTLAGVVLLGLLGAATRLLAR